jgi:ABC-type transport system substrate-binding protein
MPSRIIPAAGCCFWWRSPGTRTVCLLAAAVAVVCITGCRSGDSVTSDAETLRIGARMRGEGTKVITATLFAEPLLAIDWQGKPTERLATDWKWEDDGRTLRLILRPDARFHDGTPVTAESVAAILRQKIAKDSQGFEVVERIETPDSHSIVFRLSRPDAFLIAAVGGTLIVDDNKPDIGTGPFKLVSRTPTVEAVRNEQYYRGRPGIDRVRLFAYDTSRAASAALMRGEVDVAHQVNRESVEFLEGASRVELYPSIQPFYIPLVFNVGHPILRRVEVRRAIAEAIDRDEIVSQAMRGHGQVADDPVWPFHWAYNPAARRHTYNPAAARVRLDAAGLPVQPAPPGSHRMASRFQITCLFWNEDSQYERIGLLLQRQLAEVGIDLVLEGDTETSVAKRIKAGQFSAYLFQLTSGKSFDWTYRFWHSAPSGHAELQDSGYTGADEVLDRLRKVSSNAEIRIAVADLRERFYEDVPAAFLAWIQATRGVDTRFDVGDRSDPEIFANLWRWHPAARQRASR